MKKAAYILFLFHCFLNLYSQTIEDKDYILLNEVLPNLPSIKENDSIKMFENSVNFTNQEKIFTKDFFRDYTYPTLGVDCKKVKKLIKKLDFIYLGKQTRNISKWEFSKIEHKIIKYNEKEKNDTFSTIKYKRLFGIAKPIYSKDGNIAFIYYEYNCGLLCGQTGLKIYKKKNGKWFFYVELPITIS